MAQTFELGFSLYLIRSTETAKVYVGQTRQALDRRWAHHRHMARSDKGNGCSALHAAMRKHGIDTFSIELLGRYATQEETNAAEAAMIYALCSQAPHGYNLKEGGKASGHSPETIEKMRAAAKRRGNNRPGYRHSEETRRRISESNQGKGPPKGRRLSAETRKKISNANAGRLLRDPGYSHSDEAKARISFGQRPVWM